METEPNLTHIEAWTMAFYDKAVVGCANALVGGWGNTGGTFLYLHNLEQLRMC